MSAQYTKKSSAFTLFRLALVAFVVLSLLVSAPNTARASGPCPAPGGGQPGALNMAHDAAMGAGTATDPMIHDAAQGNAGMTTAVNNSGC